MFVFNAILASVAIFMVRNIMPELYHVFIIYFAKNSNCIWFNSVKNVFKRVAHSREYSHWKSLNSVTAAAAHVCCVKPATFTFNYKTPALLTSQVATAVRARRKWRTVYNWLRAEIC